MNGAREYANLFESGDYGKLRIVSGSHARGKTFFIYAKIKDKEVQVFGILGGQNGWTEYYGWKHKGAWIDDFDKLLKKREREVKLKKEAEEAKKIKREAGEKKAIEDLLLEY